MFINITNLVNVANNVTGTTTAEQTAMSRLQSLISSNRGYTILGTGATLPIADLSNFAHLYYNVDSGALVISNGKNWVSVPVSTFSIDEAERYALAYRSLTSGNIVNVTHQGSGTHNLNTTIDNMSNGDVLRLSAGSYDIDSLFNNTGIDGNTVEMFRNKSIAIVGQSPDSNQVVITSNPATGYTNYYYPIWGPITGELSDYTTHLAYIRFIKSQSTVNSNFSNALVSTQTSKASKGYARNVIFDMSNKVVSWLYQNSLGTIGRVRFDECSFVNYSIWDNSYSGDATSSIVVSNCAFDDTFVSTGSGLKDQINLLGTNSTSVTFDAGSYNYSGSDASGHLKLSSTSVSISIASTS